jgi:hypothetical protein
VAIDFINPITAGTVLVREAIESQNFLTGVSGWQIAANGSAEFADLLIRSSDGLNTTITLANGQVVIRNGANVIVTEIDAQGYRLYNGAGTLVAEITLFGGQANDPGFICYSPVGTRYYAMLSNGFLEFGDDNVVYDVPPAIEHFSTAGGDPISLLASSGYVGDLGAFEAATWELVGQTNGAAGDRPKVKLDSSNPGGTADVVLNGVDQPAGLTAYGAISATTATATVETVYITKANVVFRTGRAYRISVKGFFSSSVANDRIQLRVRKTNLAGIVYLNTGIGPTTPAVSTSTAFYFENICRNTSGGDLTQTLVATFVRQAGTGNMAIAAGASDPAYLYVEDIGAAADFSPACQIV